MTCKELKGKILDKSLEFDCMFFVYKDSPFLANQYADAIAGMRGWDIQPVESIDEIPEPDAFGTECNTLFVMHADEIKKSKKRCINAIFICKKTDADDAIEFPKLEDWQVLDYMKAKCPGLGEAELQWLQEICKGDIYRIEKESSKISAFPKEQQESMFDLLGKEGNYSDLSPRTIFDLTNAVLRNDRKTVSAILQEIDSMDVDGIGLATILTNGMRNVIKVQFNPTATAESLKMKDGQFRAIKYYNAGKFTNDRLISMFEFLTSIDCRLKSGELQMGDDRLIDYVVCGLLADE